MSARMRSGLTRRTATVDLDTLASGLLQTGRNHVGIARVLLNDREQPRVEEPDLEEDEERQRTVNLVGGGVEHRRREVQAERQFDERLHGDRLTVLLAD